MVSFKNDFQKLNTIKINYILIFYLRKITTSIYILMPLQQGRELWQNGRDTNGDQGG